MKKLFFEGINGGRSNAIIQGDIMFFGCKGVDGFFKRESCFYTSWFAGT